MPNPARCKGQMASSAAASLRGNDAFYASLRRARWARALVFGGLSVGPKKMLVFHRRAKKQHDAPHGSLLSTHDVGREPPQVCRRSAAAQETASQWPAA